MNNIPTLVPTMTCRRPGDKPSSETMMVSLLTHICVIRHQSFKLQNEAPRTPRPQITTQFLPVCYWKRSPTSVTCYVYLYMYFIHLRWLWLYYGTCVHCSGTVITRTTHCLVQHNLTIHAETSDAGESSTHWGRMTHMSVNKLSLVQIMACLPAPMT